MFALFSPKTWFHNWTFLSCFHLRHYDWEGCPLGLPCPGLYHTCLLTAASVPAATSQRQALTQPWHLQWSRQVSAARPPACPHPMSSAVPGHLFGSNLLLLLFLPCRQKLWTTRSSSRGGCEEWGKRRESSGKTSCDLRLIFRTVKPHME